jgi:hypothetical protein
MTDGLLIYGEIFAHLLIYYILGSPSSYMTLQLLHSEILLMIGREEETVPRARMRNSMKAVQMLEYLKQLSTVRWVHNQAQHCTVHSRWL